MIYCIEFEGNVLSFGKINIIHGKNGAGKTTFLKKIRESDVLRTVVVFGHECIIYRPPASSILVCDENLSHGQMKLRLLDGLSEMTKNNPAILMFDCPENDLGRRFEVEFVRKILDLEKSGNQIFIATHSLFMMREFELSHVKHKVFGIHNHEGKIRVIGGDSPDDSGEIEALEESLKQSDRYLNDSFEQRKPKQNTED